MGVCVAFGVLLAAVPGVQVALGVLLVAVLWVRVAVEVMLSPFRVGGQLS